jgi:hypothetical protein
MGVTCMFSQTIHRQNSLQRYVEPDRTMVSVALPLILGFGAGHAGEGFTRSSQYQSPLYTVYP